MNTELEHLKKMRDLLAKGWTQGALARNRSGRKVRVKSNKAASFCIMGAHYHVRRMTSGKTMLDALFIAAVELNIPSLTSWNDARNRTQSEVLALIDRAIEIAETEQ